MTPKNKERYVVIVVAISDWYFLRDFCDLLQPCYCKENFKKSTVQIQCNFITMCIQVKNIIGYYKLFICIGEHSGVSSLTICFLIKMPRLKAILYASHCHPEVDNLIFPWPLTTILKREWGDPTVKKIDNLYQQVYIYRGFVRKFFLLDPQLGKSFFKERHIVGSIIGPCCS